MKVATYAVLVAALAACSSGPPLKICTIADASWGEGALDPANPCQACRPKSRANDWTQLDPGTECGDGGWFCFSGSCQAGCWIPPVFYTAPGALNPDVPCQSCQPERDRFGWSPLIGYAPRQCAQGQYCALGGCQGGCFIEGREWAAGDVDPNNACRSCQPVSSASDWTSILDGPACGPGALCLAGSCQPACLVAGQIYSSGGFDPSDACLVCKPNQSTLAWSAFTGLAAGGDCDGGAVCDRGSCRQVCFIDGGVVSAQAPSPGDPCQACLPGSSATNWSPLTGLPSGGCSEGTVCSGGQCIPGCFIGGQLWSAGQTPPGDTSRCCGPNASATTWSTLFSAGPSYQMANYLQINSCPLVTGDFNGDGLIDLASGCLFNQGQSEIFFNQGAGTFGAPALLDVNCGYSMVAADLNGDGISDLICLGALEVSQRDAGGSGFVAGTFQTTAPILAVATADFNSDGIPDVLAVDDRGLSVFLGLGDGGLGPEAYYAMVFNGNAMGGALVADFNGDGLSDVASWLRAPPTVVFISLNQGGGVLGPPTQVNLGNDVVDLPSCGVVAGDFNGDQRPDLAVPFSDRIALYFGDGGGFGPALHLSTAAPNGLLAGDFNGDGHLDLLARGSQGSNVLLGFGDGTFFSPSYVSVLSPWIVAADFHGNGTLDLASYSLTQTSTNWTLWQNGCH